MKTVFSPRNWKIAETRVTALLLHPDFIYRRTSLYAEEQSIINYFLDIGPQILRNAHNLHATNLSNQSEKSAACDDDAPKSMILIDKLIEMERQGLIEYPRLIDQIHTFIVAVSGGDRRRANEVGPANNECILCDFSFHRAPTPVR